MEHNIIYRSAALIVFASLAVLLMPRSLVAAEPKASLAVKENDTPQSLVATYRHARAMKDWRTCFLCYDKKMSANFLVMLIAGASLGHDAKLNDLIEKRL